MRSKERAPERALFPLSKFLHRVGTTHPLPPMRGRGRRGIFGFPGKKFMALPSAFGKLPEEVIGLWW